MGGLFALADISTTSLNEGIGISHISGVRLSLVFSQDKRTMDRIIAKHQSNVSLSF